ncbi:hypothetical protein D3C76_1725290 [compost metagenome]
MHDDGLGQRRGRFLGKVGQLGLCGLGEDRHGVRHVGADVDIADIQRLQQRQAAWKLMPAHIDVLLREGFVQGALGLEQGDEGR